MEHELSFIGFGLCRLNRGLSGRLRNVGSLCPLFGRLTGVWVKAAPEFAMRHLLLGHFATQHLITSLRRALAQVSAPVLQARVSDYR
jgi:hypothetical protein